MAKLGVQAETFSPKLALSKSGSGYGSVINKGSFGDFSCGTPRGVIGGGGVMHNVREDDGLRFVPDADTLASVPDASVVLALKRLSSVVVPGKARRARSSSAIFLLVTFAKSVLGLLTKGIIDEGSKHRRDLCKLLASIRKCSAIWQFRVHATNGMSHLSTTPVRLLT